LTVYASYPLTPYWTFGTKYRIRNDSVNFTHDIDKQERKTADSEGLLSGAGVSLAYDSTDSAIKPHRGVRSVLDTEYTGIGGDFTFFRFGFINNIYQHLWRRGTMKYRAEFRFIEPVWKTNTFDQIPLAERFFLGGENSVRGYRAFDLGPRIGNGDDPSGGISSSLFSIEYSHEVFRFLDLFAFMDAGSVSSHRFAIGHYNLSYGVGTRIELINRVPVTLGYGFPINPTRKEQVKHFFFSMGGQF
jgi:outer membrane protein insertion porin family